MSALQIKVVCRLRPPLPHEYSEDRIVAMNVNTTSITCPTKGTTHSFPFSACYDHQSTQVEVYAGEVAEFVTKIWQGLKVTVFAYGVSGSGKTHTCSGTAEDPGLIPRVLQDLFKVVQKNRRSSTKKVELRISYLELFRDKCMDLMVEGEKMEKRADLPIREGHNGQIIVAGLSETPIKSYHEFDELYLHANARRSTASTKLNDVSSRSHAILSIILSSEDTATGKVTEGKLSLIDLAGSENNKRTGNEHSADRMKESTEINKSLHALRNVVSALNKGESRIPYRDSKLTRILSDVLGGDAAGLLICCVAPGQQFYQDTLNTLSFAGLSRNIENKTTVHERDIKPPPKPHFAASQPARTAQRPLQSHVAPVPRVPSFASTSTSAPSRQPATSRVLGARPVSVPTFDVAALDDKITKSQQAMEAKIAFLEASLREAMGKNGEEVEEGKAKSKGKKRERNDGEDEEKVEMRKRMEKLESMVEALKNPPAPAPAPLRTAVRRPSQDSTDDRAKQLYRAYLEKGQSLTRLVDRSSLLEAVANYRKALAIRRTPKLQAQLELVLEALERRVLPSFVEKERANGGGGAAKKLKTLVELDGNAVRRVPDAPIKPGWEAGKLQNGVKKSVVGGERLRVLGTPAQVKEVEVKVPDSGVEVGTPAGEKAELSGEQRRRLEELLLEVFNSMDVKRIKKLKGLGAKRAQDIADRVDEEGDLEEYTPAAAGLSKKVLEKILTDNIQLLEA